MENSHKVSAEAEVNTETGKHFLWSVLKTQMRGKAIEENQTKWDKRVLVSRWKQLRTEGAGEQSWCETAASHLHKVSLSAKGLGLRLHWIGTKCQNVVSQLCVNHVSGQWPHLVGKAIVVPVV